MPDMAGWTESADRQSVYLDEVTLVECGPGGFGAGRFTVNGYSWERLVDDR